jgi:two-component sensor histidine kinase
MVRRNARQIAVVARSEEWPMRGDAVHGVALPNAYVDGANIHPFPSRLELMTAQAGKLSPRLGSVLGVLLGAACPTDCQGRAVLAPLWAEEAMHRAYNMVQLMPRLQQRSALIADGRVALRLDLALATNLAASFRALDITDEDQEVPCSSVLRGVAQNLVALFKPAAGEIAIHTDIEPLVLPAYKRRALVLTVSELVINALRHAFGGRTHGRIHVILKAIDTASARFAVIDDGVGFATGRHARHCAVARGLVDLLEADLIYRRPHSGGVAAEVEFPTSNRHTYDAS